ncbi:MAG: hypothetical protein U1E65_23700 [Myxococcota bacterium]
MAIRPPPGDQKPPPSAPKPKSAPKPGQVPGRVGASEEEDPVHEHKDEPKLKLGREPEIKKAEAAKPSAADLAKKRREDEQKGGQGGGSQDRQPPPPPAPKEQKSRADAARDRGFQQTPAVADFIQGQKEKKGGARFAEVVPESRQKGPPRLSLPEPEIRPPIFLSTFEGMKDIYFKVKGRASPKTKELLESPALEDLVKMLAELHENEEKVRSGEAKVLGVIYQKIKDDPGPLLIGLSDPRLKEPWRLFLDGWDIWVPDDKKVEGVELFWEGEADDDEGEPMEILQTMRFSKGEIALETKLGDKQDKMSYDGQAFYRLKGS